MMETHPVDLRADVLVDRQVRAGGELLVVREPRREGRVREDELALGQRLAERLRERGHPLLCCTVALVHRREVLVVDVDPVELLVLDELGHCVARGDGVRLRRRRRVGLAKRGDDELDARLRVRGLERSLLGRRELGVCASLVLGTLEGQEGQRNDVVALGGKGDAS